MRYILLLIYTFSSVAISAQNITGRLLDPQNQPVGFANVIVLTQDSTFVAGNVSNADGTFSVASNNQSALLKISYIGYEEQVLPIWNRTDMGVIRLREEALALDEVEIKGTLPVTRIKGDAMVTSIENTILAKAGSANDVLEKIPGIMKNGETFEVFGKGEPLIYINGRKVLNKDELERLDADEIRNVELITNPGSRYDATVKAVIRIQTVKRQGDGLGIDLRSTYFQSQNTDSYNHWNINYHHNSWDFFIDGSSHLSNTNQVEISEATNRVDDVWTQSNDWESDSHQHILGSTFGFNFMPKENHSLGMKYEITGYTDYHSDTKTESLIGLNGNYYDYMLNDTHSDYKKHLTHMLNGYYNGSVNDLSIDLNVDYYKQSYEQNSIMLENSQDREDREVRSENPVNNQLAAVKLLFGHPLFGGNLTFGTEYTYTYRTDNYLSFAEVYAPTSFSKIREHNIAAFVEYGYSLPFGQLSAGLRYEHDNFDYYEDEVFCPDESRTYDNFFPNASFSTKIGNLQLQASYSAKTNRPRYFQLSNNMTYYNRFTRLTGNPALKSALTHDITLSGTWRFFQATVSFQQKRDFILQWSNPDPSDHSVVVITYQSFDKLPMLNAMISAMPAIGCWSPTFMVGIKKQWLDLKYENYDIKLSKPMFSAIFNNTITLPWNLILQANLTFIGKGDVENTHFLKNKYICNVALQKSFLKDALTIEIRGNDLFKDSINKFTMQMNRVETFLHNYYDSREFIFTLRYKFNTTPSKYKGTGAGSEQKSRF